MRQPNEKRHRDRKNPGSAEFFRKQKKERNAARPKQEFVTIIEHEEGKPDVVKHYRVRD